jgi:hypothetical protein
MHAFLVIMIVILAQAIPSTSKLQPRKPHGGTAKTLVPSGHANP